MAAANQKDKDRMVFLAYRQKRQVPNPNADEAKKKPMIDDETAPKQVRFTVEGRDFYIGFDETSENPVNFKLASRLLSKSRMWTNGAIITLEEVVSAGKKASAPVAPAAASAPVAPAK